MLWLNKYCEETDAVDIEIVERNAGKNVTE